MPKSERPARLLYECGVSFCHSFARSDANPALQQQIDKLSEPTASGFDRAATIDQCLAGISKLASEVKDASPYLPGYDQRMYTEVRKEAFI